jgi:nitroreductase
MNFTEIARTRQSCRKYDPERSVEEEKITAILEAARLSPSACNGQPYHITVCKGESALLVARATTEKGMNKFAPDAPVLMVISEEGYVPSAALGSRVMNNDYRSMDIGILSAHITLEASAQGLGSCILGWFNQKKVQEAIGSKRTVRLVITIGYPRADEVYREKKRKSLDDLVTFKD